MPAAEPLDGLRREAPRLAAVQQHREHAACVNLPLEPLGHVLGAEEAVAQRAKGCGRLLDPGVNVMVIREVAMEQRPEVDKGLADGAAAVKHKTRGAAVVVLVCPLSTSAIGPQLSNPGSLRF